MASSYSRPPPPRRKHSQPCRICSVASTKLRLTSRWTHGGKEWPKSIPPPLSFSSSSLLLLLPHDGGKKKKKLPAELQLQVGRRAKAVNNLLLAAQHARKERKKPPLDVQRRGRENKTPRLVVKLGRSVYAEEQHFSPDL